MPMKIKDHEDLKLRGIKQRTQSISFIFKENKFIAFLTYSQNQTFPLFILQLAVKLSYKN